MLRSAARCAGCWPTKTGAPPSTPAVMIVGAANAGPWRAMGLVLMRWSVSGEELTRAVVGA